MTPRNGQQIEDSEGTAAHDCRKKLLGLVCLRVWATRLGFDKLRAASRPPCSRNIFFAAGLRDAIPMPAA